MNQFTTEFKAATVAMVEAQGGIVGYVAQSAELVDALESADDLSASRL